jgi:SAM-dependent methyltransferase
MTLAATGPNAEQITYWNEVSGAKWVRFQALIDEQIGPLGRMAMDRAAIRPEERILDVGCGCGDTTCELARRTGPAGSVVGIDVSAPMLESAMSRARAAGMQNVRFWNADAQLHEFSRPEFDLVYSRFGVMFFIEPARAFANLRRALLPAGRLAFVCWQSLERNPWMAVPTAAAAAEIVFPPRSGPDAPGPFSFGDPARVRRILDEAGFSDVAIDGAEALLVVGGGGSVEEAANFLMEMGPTGAALRQADASARPRVAAAVRRALAPFEGPGGVRMRSAVWLVTARNDAP